MGTASGPRRITLSQIARQTGLSAGSVSQILNTGGADAFRQETRDRVLKAARDLGYRPSAAARGMRTGKVGAIGLLLSTVPRRSVLDYQTLVGMQEFLRTRDMHLLVGQLPDGQLVGHEWLPRILREWSTDGLIIFYTQDIPPPMIDLVSRHPAPAIWANAKLPADCIYPDDAGAARDLTRELIELGHRRVHYVVCEENAHYSRKDRRDGYRSAMQAARLGRQAKIIHAPPTDDTGRYDLSPYLTRDTLADAYVCAGPLEARAVYGAVRRLGLQVPDDVSVVAITTGPADVDGLRISGAGVPCTALGAGAAEMALEKSNDPPRPLAPRAIPFEKIPGHTICSQLQ